MTSAFGDQKVPMMTSINNVGEGWHPLIAELEVILNELSPDFELLQVKEKFGGLRYYASSQPGCTDGADQAFREAIARAEGKSVLTCEQCGEPGETHAYHGWLKTLCEVHWAERQAAIEAEQKEMER